MREVFHFKQFDINQTGCAMKINTDGVLLGAMSAALNPVHILDIGTGTGVIALMLAQRFPLSQISAVEIDETAAATADLNFKNSIFHQQLQLLPVSIQHYFNQHPHQQFDLIVSNPPFFLHSLESKGAKKAIAKHTDVSFFKYLFAVVGKHLLPNGLFWLILPINTAAVVHSLTENEGLFLHKKINIHSFSEDQPHREMLAFGRNPIDVVAIDKFVIYQQVQLYTKDYQALLKDYFTIF